MNCEEKRKETRSTMWCVVLQHDREERERMWHYGMFLCQRCLLLSKNCFYFRCRDLRNCYLNNASIVLPLSDEDHYQRWEENYETTGMTLSFVFIHDKIRKERVWEMEPKLKSFSILLCQLWMRHGWKITLAPVFHLLLAPPWSSLPFIYLSVSVSSTRWRRGREDEESWTRHGKTWKSEGISNEGWIAVTASVREVIMTNDFCQSSPEFVWHSLRLFFRETRHISCSRRSQHSFSLDILPSW